MDNTNKIISFVLGLIVVVVFLIIITGRLNLKKINFLPLSKATPTAKLTPTPTPKFTSLNPGSSQNYNNNYGSGSAGSGTYSPYNGMTTIPATGAPTILLPVALSSLLGGIFLRRKK